MKLASYLYAIDHCPILLTCNFNFANITPPHSQSQTTITAQQFKGLGDTLDIVIVPHSAHIDWLGFTVDIW